MRRSFRRSHHRRDVRPHDSYLARGEGRLPQEIEVLNNAEDAYVDDGIALLNLARKAHSTFNLQ